MPKMVTEDQNKGLGILALLCCVFDKEEGPIVLCSDPSQALRDHFKPLGRYLLPEAFVKGRVVSVVLDDTMVIGAPVYINDVLYDRNCFQFNICAVVSSRLDPAPYRDLAQHLAVSFYPLEVDLKFLSRTEKVRDVVATLASLRAQLNRSRECFLPIDNSHCVCFRVRMLPMRMAPDTLDISMVPVPLVALKEALDTNPAARRRQGGRTRLQFEPDLVLLHLIPLIDGIRTISEISIASEIDLERVRLCIRHLIHFSLVAVIDEIRPEHCYRVTDAFHYVFDSEEVTRDVVHYVTGQRNKVPVHAVLGLYAGLSGFDSTTLQEFRDAHAEDLQAWNISLRHFIAFGLLHGFLERVKHYMPGFSQEEVEELQSLRNVKIPEMKRRYENMGYTKIEVNKQPEVADLVRKMKELKDKDKEKATFNACARQHDH